jgi:hypothetical protein
VVKLGIDTIDWKNIRKLDKSNKCGDKAERLD